MLRKLALLAAVFCLPTVWAFARSSADTDMVLEGNDEVSATAGVVGSKMFMAWLNDNGAIERTAATLMACHQDNLAKTIIAKEIDPRFEQRLLNDLADGSFVNQSAWAPLLARNTAKAMSVGYSVGYRSASKALVDGMEPAFRKSFCDRIIKATDDFLKGAPR